MIHDDECDHGDEEEITMVAPDYPLTPHDFIGIGLRTLANITNAISVGFHMAASEFFAAGALARERAERREIARAADRDLQTLLEGGMLRGDS